MPDPLFDSRTPRLDLPLLFAGQAQKEVYLNESLARLDALLHSAIEAQTGTPPTAPQEGQCWLVGSGATGAWTGHSNQVACYQQGQWLFQAPRDGLRVFNRATGQELLYFGAWKTPSKPASPTGGTVIDTQARATLTALIDSLVAAGILPAQ